MEFADVVRRRRMVRRFDPQAPVPEEAVERMLHNATRAPSAGFSQGWAFLALTEPVDVERFWDSAIPAGWEEGGWLSGMRTAPVIIVPLSCKQAYLDRYAEPDKGWTDRDEARWPVPYWHVDTGMAALLVLQTAVDAGLGACLFGIPPETVGDFRVAFGVPDSHTPIGAVAVGHPARGGAQGSPRRRARRNDVVHRGRWGSRG